MTYPPGALRALKHLTREWQFPSRAGFNASGAWSAACLRLAEQQQFQGRSQYRLTDLGAEVKGNGNGNG
jgi:hypothetical protein